LGWREDIVWVGLDRRVIWGGSEDGSVEEGVRRGGVA
jgi:hypothetical protein